MVLSDILPSINYDCSLRLNTDTGTNYSSRWNNLGTGDNTGVNVAQGVFGIRNETDSVNAFNVGYISNLSTKEKLGIGFGVHGETAGAGTAPARREAVTKHAQTTNPISEIQVHNIHSGDFPIGSECVVLGWDPADTHTSNFWEELASVTLGSAGDTIDSGTITAKKYLWIQSFGIASGVIDQLLQFNSDTGNNYTYRYSDNGAADGTGTTTNKTLFGGPTGAYNSFGNMFVINNSANEKLCIGNGVAQNTAGAGTAPTRREHVDKWTNTASQITSVQIINQGAGSFDTGSILKVWGSD